VEVAQFNTQRATDDLVHHEFPSGDGFEQRTEFASGTKVRIRACPILKTAPTKGN